MNIVLQEGITQAGEAREIRNITLTEDRYNAVLEYIESNYSYLQWVEKKIEDKITEIEEVLKEVA